MANNSSLCFQGNCSLLDQCPDVEDLNAKHFHVFIPILCFMIALMLIGMLGNLVVLVVFAFKKKKAAANNYMMALAGVDFFSCAVIHPYFISKMAHMFSPFDITCKLFEFLNHSGLSVQLCILLSVATDRFYSVCKPLKHFKSLKRSVFLIVFSFTSGCGGSLPLLAFYGLFTLEEYAHCSKPVRICHYNDRYNRSTHQRNYGLSTLFVMSSMLMAIAVLYIRVIASIYNRYKGLSSEVGPAPGHSMTPVAVPIFHIHEPLSSSGHQNENRTTRLPKPQCKSRPKVPLHMKRSVRTAKILFAVTAIFILSWVPFWAVKLSSKQNEHDSIENVSSLVLGWANHFFFINNAVNPFIFLFTSKAFRGDCVQFWTRLKVAWSRMDL